MRMHCPRCGEANCWLSWETDMDDDLLVLECLDCGRRVEFRGEMKTSGSSRRASEKLARDREWMEQEHWRAEQEAMR